MITLLRFDLFAGTAHRIRKTVYILDRWFMIKGYSAGTARRRDAQGKVRGQGRGASMLSLSAPLFPHLHVFVNPDSLRKPVHLGFYGGFITWAWLMNSLSINDWSNLQPIFLPRKLWGEAGSSSPLITGYQHWLPSFGASKKITSLTSTQVHNKTFLSPLWLLSIFRNQ